MTTSRDEGKLAYLQGFDNHLKSEADGFEGSLPKTNNPQRLSIGGWRYVAEQLSGTAFTAPRATNKYSWLYRKRPSVCHLPFQLSSEQLGFESGQTVANQTRWLPFADEESITKCNDFREGLKLLVFSDADGCQRYSVAIYICIFNQSMNRSSLVNADGDFLIVPQLGSMTIQTEFGVLQVRPGEICVIQQGMKFSVEAHLENEPYCRAYVLEVKGNHFQLPELGPIGANGLARPGDFKVPTAAVGKDTPHQIVLKFQNKYFSCEQEHTPYDVAAWHGNYYPYKYDLDDFVSLNSVSVDHPDPSIFTVLTCPSDKAGTALADFVIFPPRWECANETFRPPYFHRNCMTEFMGLIKGQYQAKGSKFAPGGASLHQSMMPHGPDYECYKRALEEDTSEPRRVADGTMAFMFETSMSLKVTTWAMNQAIDGDYHACWHGFKKNLASMHDKE